MGTKIEAKALPSGDVEVELVDGETKASFRLDTHEIVHLFAVLGEALQQLPSDQTAELHELQPALRAHPSYQLASSPDGDLVLIFQASPLPPFHFVIDDDRAAALRSQIDRFLNIPRPARYSRPQ